MKNLIKAFLLTLAFCPMFHMVFSGLVFFFSDQTYTEVFFSEGTIIGSLIQLPLYSIIVYVNVFKEEEKM